MARTTTTSPLLGRVGLEYGVMLYQKKMTNLWKQLAPRTRTTSQTSIKVFQEGDFGMAPTVNEMGGIPFDDLSTPYNMEVTPVKRGIAFAMSSEADESDQYGVLRDVVGKIARAFNKTKEQASANLFNLATAADTNGPDGKPWAADDHPLEDGSTADNKFTAALSATAVENLIEELRLQKTHRGDPMPIMGPYLLMVHPSQEFLARRIIESTLLQGTPNNDKNVAGSELRLHSNPYFTNALAWGIKSLDAEEQGAVFLSRRSFKAKEDDDIIRDAKVIACTEIYSFFQDSWRGFVYSDGTA